MMAAERDDNLVEALKAMAHPLRLRIMRALRAGELNVGDIETATGIGQPALSQQLGVLRKSGLVDTRKDAKLVFYRIADDRLSEVCADIAGLSGAVGLTIDRRIPAPGVANFARLG